ncbi:MAG: class I SAM-dependent methyltransferase [Candidatus Izemoplasmatales bacterium]|nr:class I SAM-dependent methyltransferase [Candidatus Izemoplasmatales bacterium]MDD4595504.1 class I SAM-dependent methyltransferase [Candidatus Izemoplasmatales bacterium]
MNLNLSTKCPLCGFPSLTCNNNGFELHKCQNCGLVFKNYIYFQNANQEKERYDKHSTNPDAGYLKSINDFIALAIIPLQNVITVLDYGCGRIGYLGTRLADAGYRVSMYDLYYHSDKLALEKQYDLVTLVEVVEHFQNPEIEFTNLCQLIKKNGYLAIKTQFVPKELNNWWYIRDITHYCFFSDQSLLYIAAKYGLDIIYNDHIQTIVYQKK